MYINLEIESPYCYFDEIKLVKGINSIDNETNEILKKHPFFKSQLESEKIYYVDDPFAPVIPPSKKVKKTVESVKNQTVEEKK